MINTLSLYVIYVLYRECLGNVLVLSKLDFICDSLAMGESVDRRNVAIRNQVSTIYP